VGQIRVRAEHRVGQLLRQIAIDGERHSGQAKPGHKVAKESSNTTPTLDDLGITRDQSSKWQKLAEIPDAGRQVEFPPCLGMTRLGIVDPEPT
jgi:hypothetical protein